MGAGNKREHWSTKTFLLLFGFTLAVLIWISSPFMVALILSAAAAVLLSGVNEWLVARLGGRRGPAALIMSFGTLFVLLVPLVVITVILVQAAVPLFGAVSRAVASGRLDDMVLERVPASLRERLAELPVERVQEAVGQGLSALAAGLASFAASVPGLAAQLGVQGTITLMALYYFFSRGPRLGQAIVEAMPMEKRYTRNLLDTIRLSIQTVFGASFVTALFQFALAWPVFAIVGTPYPLALAGVLAFFSFIFSLVPMLGSGLVTVPLAGYLFLVGRPIAGLAILAFAIFVIGSVDNVVKPLYTKGKLQLPPLVVFVTLFGGIAIFGAVGALVGPLVAAVAAAFHRIWTTDFLTDVEPRPEIVERKDLAEGKRRRFPRLRRKPPEQQPPAGPPDAGPPTLH